MPLLKRVIQPSHVSRVPMVQEWVRDESGRVFPAMIPATDPPQDLDAFSNLTLANLITQLSSLSRHAEDLFGEMIADSTAIMNRTISLQGRVDKLAVKVKNLDSNVEEVSLQDIHMRKAFKSSTLFDQQVVSRDTIPAAMLDTYTQCDQPPPLDQLNPYRDDGKDGLKFYTDPSYFFNLWREEITKETEQLKDNKKKPGKPKGDGRKKSKVRQASNTRDKHKQLAIAKGEHIEGYVAPNGTAPSHHQNDHPTYISNSAHNGNNQMAGYGTAGNYPQSYLNQENFGIYGQTTYDPHSQTADNQGGISRKSLQNNVNNRPSQPPPAPPSGESPQSSHATTPTRQSLRPSQPPPPLPVTSTQQVPSPPPPHEVDGRQAPDLLPPPPPIPIMDVDLPPPSPPPPPPIAPQESMTNGGPPPPPPPPPPMMNGNAPPPPPLPNGDIKMLANIASVTLKPAPKKVPQETDQRCDLLKAIRHGIKLRKVDASKKLPVGGAGSKGGEDAVGDVASILQRRFAFEVSDSESSSDSDSADSDDWDETSA